MIVFSGSFHGRTHLTMAMTTSKTGYRGGYAPLPAGIFVAPFPDPLADDEDAEIDRALAGFDHLLASQTAPAETAAIIIEPVLGEGGYIPAPARFLQGLAAAVRAARHPVRRRRGADRVRPHGRDVRGDARRASSPTCCAWRRASRRASRSPRSAHAPRSWTAGRRAATAGRTAAIRSGCAAALASIEVMTEPGFLDNVNARGAQLRSGLGRARRVRRSRSCKSADSG